MLPLCPLFPEPNYNYFKIYIVPVSLEPLLHVTLGVCLHRQLRPGGSFSAGQCGVLLISAKARCTAMNKALPQGRGKTSHIWQIQTFKTYFYSPWKRVIVATLRWTQRISVQIYSEQEQHREHFCAELQGRAPAFLGWKMRQVMV